MPNFSSYDECKADATLGIPAEQMMELIRSQHCKRTAAQG